MAEAGRAEGGAAPVASLERALDQVLDFLGRTEQTARVRALAIEARRLRGAVGKWRSIEPSDDTREEMVTRVLRLANDAEEAVAEARAASGESGQSSPAMRAITPGPGMAPAQQPRLGSAPSLPALNPAVVGANPKATLPLAMPNPAIAGANPKATLPYPGLQKQQAAARAAEVNRYAPAAVPAIPDLGPGGGSAPSPYEVPTVEMSPAALSRGLQASREPAGPPDLSLEMPPGAARAATPYGAQALVRQGPADLAGPVPRLPSLQIERVAPPNEVRPAEFGGAAAPRPELSAGVGAGAGRGSRPDLAAAGRELTVRSADDLAWNAEPPSLQLDAPPLSARDEADTTLFALPSGIKDLQALSVYPSRRPDNLDPHLVMVSEPYGARADAYRALRRRLATSPARIIAVTSARPREGKTICAVNLALALAESSPRNVLVVEGNIRSPGLAATLKFDPPVCFVEQMKRRRKDPDEPWVVVEQTSGDQEEVGNRTSIHGGAVHLLAVDPRSEKPPMLDAVGFQKGIESLKRAGYEYIIIDTPAVLGTLDMQNIGDVVEGVIFTSIVKRSSRGPLREAIAQIKPAPVLGVVLLE